MATTDISLVNNVVKVTPEGGTPRQFSLQPASYAFNERSELQLSIDGATYQIPLADLRINGAGSAPTSTSAALTSLSSTFPAWNQTAYTLNEILATSNNAGGLKITNAADPEDDQDVVTKAYGDANYGGSGSSGYLSYVALLTQSGTDNIVIHEKTNTIEPIVEIYNDGRSLYIQFPNITYDPSKVYIPGGANNNGGKCCFFNDNTCKFGTSQYCW